MVCLKEEGGGRSERDQEEEEEEELTDEEVRYVEWERGVIQRGSGENRKQSSAAYLPQYIIGMWSGNEE